MLFRSTFASQGPGTFVPADGAVEGWRYAITTQAASTPPDPAPDFSSVCRSTPEQAHRKRVALVVDSGPTGIGPAGEDAPALLTACVVADVDATGYAILSSIVDVRTESGLVCGLDGYPAAECAPVVDDAEIAAASARTESTAPAPSPSTAAPASAALASPDGSGGSPLTTIVVAALLLGGATLALVLRRRGR